MVSCSGGEFSRDIVVSVRPVYMTPRCSGNRYRAKASSSQRGRKQDQDAKTGGHHGTESASLHLSVKCTPNPSAFRNLLELMNQLWKAVLAISSLYICCLMCLAQRSIPWRLIHTLKDPILRVQRHPSDSLRKMRMPSAALRTMVFRVATLVSTNSRSGAPYLSMPILTHPCRRRQASITHVQHARGGGAMVICWHRWSIKKSETGVLGKLAESQ